MGGEKVVNLTGERGNTRETAHIENTPQIRLMRGARRSLDRVGLCLHGQSTDCGAGFSGFAGYGN